MEARYLMLDPRSYELTREELFKIQTCQFCEHTEFNYQRFLPTPYVNSNYSKGIMWVQKCKGCKKTVSVVKKPELA